MQVNNSLKIDFKYKNYNLNISAFQGETKSRYIDLQILSNGTVVNLTNHTIKVYAVKPDKTKVFNNCTITDASSGKAQLELTSQMLAVPGTFQGQFIVYGQDGSKINTQTFNITVEKTLEDDTAIESTDQFNALIEGIVKLEAWDSQFQSIYDSWSAQFQTKYNGLEAQYATDLTTVKSSLADITTNKLPLKANQTDLTSGLDSKRDKIAPIVMADLSTEVKSAFTGGAVAVVGENAVGRENVKNLAIYPEKISTDSDRINLLDLNAVLANSIFNATNGQIITFSTLSVSGFIPISNGKQYTLSNGQQTNLIALYDTNQAFLSVITGNTGSTAPFTFTVSNANAKYMRVNMQDAKYPVNQFMIAEGTTLPSTYTPYSTKKTYSFPWLLVDKTQINNFVVNPSDVSGSTVYPVNLYNKYMSTDGQIFNASTGAPMSFGNFTLSDFMAVQVNTSYTINRGDTANLVAMYDVNKTFLGVISGTASGTLGTFTFTITNVNCVYIRLNIDITKNDKNTFMVVKGTTLPSTYYAYGNVGFELNGLKVLNNNIVYSKWLNKKVYLFGDSITYWDARYSWFDANYYMVGYPTYIRNELGATTINKGSAGATLSTQETNNIHNIITSTSLTDAYACTITGGTNDISHNVPIGNLGGRNDTTFDTTTYIGALRDAIHYCYSQNPKIKIYLLAPINMTSTVVTAYCDAMESVANMYSIPILRMDKTVQINPRNASTLLVDGVHPNNDGFKVMADVMIPFLKNN